MKKYKMFLLVIILFIGVFGMYFFITNVVNSAEPTSMFFKLQSVNSALFLKSFSGCILAYAVYFATIPNIILIIKPSISKNSMRKFLFFSSKLFITFSFIFSLLVSLTEDQFTVVTGVISFFALFSFIFPKNIFKHLKKITKELSDTDSNK